MNVPSLANIDPALARVTAAERQRLLASDRSFAFNSRGVVAAVDQRARVTPEGKSSRSAVGSLPVRAGCGRSSFSAMNVFGGMTDRGRPITAIRNGDLDGNDATEREAGWTPLNDTPMHPEYPSQAAIISGAAMVVFESVFGPRPGIAFTATDLLDPNITRPFPDIGAMAEEHKVVRIWGGIHFRNSLEVGDQMGRKISVYLIDNSIKPVR